jgi:hypothetical protein
MGERGASYDIRSRSQKGEVGPALATRSARGPAAHFQRRGVEWGSGRMPPEFHHGLRKASSGAAAPGRRNIDLDVAGSREASILRDCCMLSQSFSKLCEILPAELPHNQSVENNGGDNRFLTATATIFDVLNLHIGDEQPVPSVFPRCEDSDASINYRSRLQCVCRV